MTRQFLPHKQRCDMNDVTTEQRKLAAERLAIVRAKLLATGATVLSPTAEWTALRKEMLELNRKLKYLALSYLLGALAFRVSRRYGQPPAPINEERATVHQEVS